MKIEWQDLPLLGYGYFAKVVFKSWTKNIANWSGCWYVASNIWYFFFLMRNDRVLVEKMNVLFKLLAFMKRRGQKSSPPPLRPLLDKGHTYITSAKELGTNVGQKMTVFADIQYCIHASGWVRKGPKIC